MKIDRVFQVESTENYVSRSEARRVADLLESSSFFEKEVRRIRKRFNIQTIQQGEKGSISVEYY